MVVSFSGFCKTLVDGKIIFEVSKKGIRYQLIML